MDDREMLVHWHGRLLASVVKSLMERRHLTMEQARMLLGDEPRSFPPPRSDAETQMRRRVLKLARDVLLEGSDPAGQA